MKKKYDVLALGELNVDLILTGLSSLPLPGRELLAETCTLTMGSSTAICAAGMASLGLSTGFLGKVGNDDYGRLAAKTLEGYGVDLSHLIVDDNLQTGITVSIAAKSNKDRALVTYLGAINALTVEDVSDELLDTARHIHVGSFFLQSGLRPGLADLFARARAKGVTTSLDAGYDDSETWDFGIKDVLAQTDVFLPNEVEASAITGLDSMEEAALELSKLCRICVVKCGPAGVVVASEGEVFAAPTFDAIVRDTTGAGDSFNAGFLYAFLQGKTLRDAADYGNACGSVSVTRLGGASSCASLAEAEEVIRTGGTAFLEK